MEPATVAVLRASGFGVSGATVAINAMSTSEEADWALRAYAVCFPLLFAGLLVSNYWWARRTADKAA